MDPFKSNSLSTSVPHRISTSTRGQSFVHTQTQAQKLSVSPDKTKNRRMSQALNPLAMGAAFQNLNAKQQDETSYSSS